MKKIILLIALTLGALQASTTIIYGTDDNSGISKPNYPNEEIYIIKK